MKQAVNDRPAPTERRCPTLGRRPPNGFKRTQRSIPRLWALAKPPINDRIGALQVCADMEPIPTLTIEQLIQREMSFHTATFAIFGNPALIYLSALLHERLDGFLPGIALLPPPGHRTLPHPPRDRRPCQGATGTRPYGRPTTARTASMH